MPILRTKEGSATCPKDEENLSVDSIATKHGA